MEFHEVANIFPLLQGDEFDEFCQDVKSNGLLEAIWLHPDGRIIDGRNRYNACLKVGVEPMYRTWEGQGSLTDFVLSLNLHRRHLNPGQRGGLGVRVETLYAKEAKDRQRLSEGRGVKGPAILPDLKDKQGDARDKAAKAVGASGNYVSTMKRIKRDAPQVFEQVMVDEISITEAKKLVKLPADERETAQKMVDDGKATSIKTAIKKIETDSAKQSTMASERKLTEEFTPPVVHQMDCVGFLSSFDDNHFDLLLTDPPYSTDVDNITDFASGWLSLALSKVKPTGRAYICIGAYPNELKAYLDILTDQDKFILDNPLIWTYRNTLGQTPKMKYNLNYQIVLHLYSSQSAKLDTTVTNEMFSVQDINAPDGRQGDRYHAWQKPKELARRIITHSTKPGDKIADPFACTGTFLIVASQLGRDPVGCDISAKNLEIAQQRGCDVIFE